MADILVIHRENYISTKIYDCLRGEGHKVACSGSREETLSIIDELSLDLVMIDATLDDSNGADLFCELQSRVNTLEAILICKKPDLKTVINSIQGGIRDYLITPIENNALIRTVTRILQHKKMQDLNRRLTDENLLYQNHLEQMIAKKAASLNDLIHKTIRARDREKTEMAHALFDSCLQDLKKTRIAWEAYLSQSPSPDLDTTVCTHSLERALEQTRALIASLNPLQLEKQGMKTALLQAASVICPAKKLDAITLSLKKTASLLSGGWDLHLYRALEEILLASNGADGPLSFQDSDSDETAIRIQISNTGLAAEDLASAPALAVAKERIKLRNGSLSFNENRDLLLTIPLEKRKVQG